MLKTANPALNRNTFVNAEKTTQAHDTMTLEGAVNKSGWMLLLLVGAAVFVWRLFFRSGLEAIMPFMMLSGIGGFIIGFITIFSKVKAPITAPLYAICEGLFLGGLSAMLETQYPGIVIQAVALTFGTFLTLLAVYKSRMIEPSENFKLGVVAATGGICLIYFITFILSLFKINVGYIHGSGMTGILFSLFVVIVAALNLVLDFDFIERGAESGAPKYMEWYSAFGLMVTLIWLYIEILNLLVKLRNRD